MMFPHQGALTMLTFPTRNLYPRLSTPVSSRLKQQAHAHTHTRRSVFIHTLLLH